MPDEEESGIGLLSGAPPVVPTAKPVPAAEAALPAAPGVTAPPKGRISGHLSLTPADEAERHVTAGTISTLSAVIRSSAPEPVTVSLTVDVAYTSTYPGEGAEWPVRWLVPGKKTFQDVVRRREKTPVQLTPNQATAISFEVTAPVGVRFGDRVELKIQLVDEAETTPPKLTLSWQARQAVLAIKTSRGYEREVADTLRARAEEKPDVIFSLLVPGSIRGYLFAEGMSFEGVREMLRGIRKARGLIEGETSLKEVEPLLVPKITVEGFVEGAIVELISGPFKGEKARVKKIDQAKEEITVELIEAVVPIPVTVRGDHVRMLEKGGGKSGG